MMAKQITGLEAYKWRKKLKMNQTQFWSRVGVTQSGGSRYEAGRRLPAAIRMLLTMAYGTDAQAKNVFSTLRAAPGNSKEQ